MRDRLRSLLMKHVGGIPVGAVTENQLCDVLEAHLFDVDCQANKLLGYLAETRDHILWAIKHLDSVEYEGLLGPCVASPAEVVGAAEVLRGLVTGSGMDYHVVLGNDGKMWNVFLDGELVFALCPGDVLGMACCLKLVLHRLSGRAMIEAPLYMVPGLTSSSPGNIWTEVVRLIDEGEHVLVGG